MDALKRRICEMVRGALLNYVVKPLQAGVMRFDRYDDPTARQHQPRTSVLRGPRHEEALMWYLIINIIYHSNSNVGLDAGRGGVSICAQTIEFSDEAAACRAQRELINQYKNQYKYETNGQLSVITVVCPKGGA